MALIPVVLVAAAILFGIWFLRKLFAGPRDLVRSAARRHAALLELAEAYSVPTDPLQAPGAAGRPHQVPGPDGFARAKQQFDANAATMARQRQQEIANATHQRSAAAHQAAITTAHKASLRNQGR
jgi:hypothetical protein